jgi:pimeloyl-ACP methyl ester carboxylesterase
VWQAQRHLIFVPDAVVDRTPEDVGLAFDDVAIPLPDGSAIAAWWLPRGFVDPKSLVVLYLHGNDGNLARELGRLQALHAYGLPVLSIDYRGYGRSSGPFPSEAQVYDDAVSAWSYLVNVRRINPGGSSSSAIRWARR